ncbi:MAG: hypothetical protein AAGH38_01390 [Pseudomonadota bacterium]
MQTVVPTFDEMGRCDGFRTETIGVSTLFGSNAQLIVTRSDGLFINGDDDPLDHCFGFEQCDIRGRVSREITRSLNQDLICDVLDGEAVVEVLDCGDFFDISDDAIQNLDAFYDPHAWDVPNGVDLTEAPHWLLNIFCSDAIKATRTALFMAADKHTGGLGRFDPFRMWRSSPAPCSLWDDLYHSVIWQTQKALTFWHPYVDGDEEFAARLLDRYAAPPCGPDGRPAERLHEPAAFLTRVVAGDNRSACRDHGQAA